MTQENSYLGVQVQLKLWLIHHCVSVLCQPSSEEFLVVIGKGQIKEATQKKVTVLHPPEEQ